MIQKNVPTANVPKSKKMESVEVVKDINVKAVIIHFTAIKRRLRYPIFMNPIPVGDKPFNK